MNRCRLTRGLVLAAMAFSSAGLTAQMCYVQQYFVPTAEECPVGNVLLPGGLDCPGGPWTIGSFPPGGPQCSGFISTNSVKSQVVLLPEPGRTAVDIGSDNCYWQHSCHLIMSPAFPSIKYHCVSSILHPLGGYWTTVYALGSDCPTHGTAP